MRRLLLVANPAASGFTGALHREVVSTLSTTFDVAPVWPNSADEARQAAAHAAESGFEVVAAMGGDGVAHFVANGLAASDAALGLIPAGTTNVLARILGFPTRPRQAARALADATAARRVNVAHIVAEGPRMAPVSMYGLFAVGIGFDAEVVEAAEKRPHSKLHFGGLHYAQTAVGTMWSRFRGRPPNLRVEAEGRRADGVSVMVQIHDTYTYFGPRPLPVGPEPAEGLTVLVLDRLDVPVATAMFPRLMTGRSLERVPGAEVWTGIAKLIVEADPPARMQADGELIGDVTAVEIAPAPRYLWVAG